MYGLVQDINRFTGKPQKGCYSTPDGQGHIEGSGRQWEATRRDVPGVTANCETLAEAADFAHYGGAA